MKPLSERAIAVRDAMEEARRVFHAEIQAAESELTAASCRAASSDENFESWDLIEAHSKYRNRIEAAAFAMRLTFLKASGRRE